MRTRAEQQRVRLDGRAVGVEILVNRIVNPHDTWGSREPVARCEQRHEVPPVALGDGDHRRGRRGERAAWRLQCRRSVFEVVTPEEEPGLRIPSSQARRDVEASHGDHGMHGLMRAASAVRPRVEHTRRALDVRPAQALDDADVARVGQRLRDPDDGRLCATDRFTDEGPMIVGLLLRDLVPEDNDRLLRHQVRVAASPRQPITLFSLAGTRDALVVPHRPARPSISSLVTSRSQPRHRGPIPSSPSPTRPAPVAIVQ